MKVLKFISISILVLVITAIIAGFIIIKKFDINQFVQKMTQELSHDLNREVKVGDVNLQFSLSKGFLLDVKGVTIADDLLFSSENLLEIGSTHLHMDVMRLLTKRQISVRQIELRNPKINLVLGKEGTTNIQALVDQAQKLESAGPKQSQAQGKPNAAVDQNTVADFTIDAVNIVDGQFSVVDQSSDEPATITIKNFNLNISNVAFDKPFPFDISFSLFSDVANIHAKGLVQVNKQKEEIIAEKIAAEIDLSDFSLAQLTTSIPALKELGLEDKIQGKLKLMVEKAVANASGLTKLSANGELIDGKVKVKYLPYPVDNIDLRFDMTESEIDIHQLFMYLASGKIDIKGKLKDYLNTQPFNFDMTIEELDLKELLVTYNLPVDIEGKMFGEVHVKGEGLQEADLEQFLNGNGSVNVKEGKIVDVNVLKLVLSKLSFIPNLAEKLESNLPEKYKKQLNRKDTILGRVETIFNIQGNVRQIESLEVGAEGFLLKAGGQVDTQKNLTLNADFYVTEELSASLVAAEENLSLLSDESGRIHIPFKTYNGPIEKFIIYPDIGDLGSRAIRAKGKEELQKVLRKALDIDDPSPSDGVQAESDAPAKSQPKRESSPEEALIDAIFNAIPNF